MPDQATIEGCTCFRLRRTTRSMTRFYDAHLLADGLTLTQYSLLSKLARAPALSIHELADLMGMDRTSLTRTLVPLEASGFLSIERGDDRRSKIVILTSEGRQTRQAAEGHWQAAQDEIKNRLGEASLGELHKLLDAAFERLAD
jgi:DNA-binding MarR family transcriptional regulator